MSFKTPMAYRLYSSFTGPNPNIVSQTAANRINTILNPARYDGYLADKNNFDKLFAPGILPVTIIRKIGGQAYTPAYEPIDRKSITDDYIDQITAGFDRIISKPSIDSDSGHGIELFTRIDGRLTNKAGQPFNAACFDSLGEDIIIQEALMQSDFMARFNPTSVNTIRIATYRSVRNNDVHLLSAVIRMGSAGKFIDNLHGGGKMVRICNDNYLADHCVDQYGTRYTTHNGVDFSDRIEFPEFDRVKELVTRLSLELVDTRLIQWDIMIDRQGNPRVIEFNIGGFSMWIAQMTGTPAYGDYTDEIIEYAASRHVKKLF